MEKRKKGKKEENHFWCFNLILIDLHYIKNYLKYIEFEFHFQSHNYYTHTL
jgi:hypothetical protein